MRVAVIKNLGMKRMLIRGELREVRQNELMAIVGDFDNVMSQRDLTRSIVTRLAKLGYHVPSSRFLYNVIGDLDFGDMVAIDLVEPRFELLFHCGNENW